MLHNFNVFEDKVNGVFQVRTKTDVYVIEFQDEQKTEIFKALAELSEKDPEISLSEIIKKFEKDYPKEKIYDVLQELDSYSFLTYENADELHKATGKAPDNRYASYDVKKVHQITFVGQKELGNSFINKAEKYGFQGVKFIEITPDLRESQIKKMLNESDFLVVDAHHWNPAFLEEFNELAVEANKPWLHIGGLEGSNLKIGPIFWGEECGCYNCLKLRIDSHNDFLAYGTEYENYLKQNRMTSKPDRLQGYEVMLDMIASYAAIETSKFLHSWSVPETWKAYVSIDVLSYNVQKHHLLKVPFCEVCQPQLEYSPAPWLEPVTLRTAS